jgi:SAM-dependent methyltransferase
VLEGVERLTSGRRLVDLGCGGGHLLSVAAERGWWALGTDVSHAACAAALKSGGGPVVQADGDRLPIVGRAFAAATLVNVLDHLVDPAAALAEAHRVLTPGGVLAIRVINGRFHRTCFGLARWLGPLGRWTGLAAYPVLHVHAFTGRGLRRLVEAAGFQVLEVRNSSPAAEGPAWNDAPADARLPALRKLTAVAAGAAALLSGGRWLLAPSIELYARWQPGPSGRGR